MPNLNVFRPADAIETAECWELALNARTTPSVLSLSRQNLPTLERPVAENLSARGGYVLREADGARDVTLIATGSEVAIALDTSKLLAAQGKRAAVVSLPSFELFAAQDDAYRAKVLGTGAARRRRGRRALRLGPLARRTLGLRRHDGLWRQRAGRRALCAFRHHARGSGEGGAGGDGVGNDRLAVIASEAKQSRSKERILPRFGLRALG